MQSDGKRRIAFVLSTLGSGGAERVTLNIINSLDTEKFDLHLVVLQDIGELFDQLPSHITLHRLDATRTLFAFNVLRNLLKEIKPHIVYATLFHTAILLHYTVRFLSDKPKEVFRCPTSPKIAISEGHIGFLYKYLLKKIYARSDKIIAQTPEMKEEIATYFNVEKEKIDLLINPIDKALIRRKIDSTTSPFSDETINVVAAGRLSYEKGFDILIESFRRVVNKNKNFRLHIIGRDDGEKKNLEVLIDRLGLEEYVTLWGFQDNPYRFFYFGDMYVLSSRREGLPNTVLENLYLGQWVVATRCVPFLDSLILNGVNGSLVEVGDKEALAEAILSFNKSKKGKIALPVELGDPNGLFLNLA